MACQIVPFAPKGRAEPSHHPQGRGAHTSALVTCCRKCLMWQVDQDKVKVKAVMVPLPLGFPSLSQG